MLQYSIPLGLTLDVTAGCLPTATVSSGPVAASDSVGSLQCRRRGWASTLVCVCVRGDKGKEVWGVGGLGRDFTRTRARARVLRGGGGGGGSSPQLVLGHSEDPQLPCSSFKLTSFSCATSRMPWQRAV